MNVRPICDRCNRPVESFTETVEDFIGRVVYTARCHGETLRVSINQSELKHASGLTFDRVFVQPKALPQPKEEKSQ